MDFLLHLDEILFFWIHESWENPVFDALMPLLREKFFWIPLYIFMLAFLMINFRSKGWLISLFLIFTVGLSDTMSSKVIKPAVKRQRPCQRVDWTESVTPLARCGSGYSFTSSHATNHFAVAFFLILTIGKVIRKIRWPLIIWASAVSLAQVYVGLHYPVDILGGGILGYFIAKVVASVYNRRVEPFLTGTTQVT
jgi:undecaprenyl-diphosphatase